MSEPKEQVKVAIAPMHMMTKTKEVLDRNGNVIKTEVIKPKQ